MRVKSILLSAVAAIALSACGGTGEAPVSGETESSERTIPALPHVRTVTIAPDGDFVTNLQTALITAQEGDTIKLPEGTFNLTDGLSLDVDRVTLKGAGEGKTVLNFAGQTGAGEGLLVTGDDVLLNAFSLQDTAGDGIKSKGADRIIYRDITVEWTNGPDASNGAYGFYPVESKDVLIENVTVRAASDAGIYVGQSRNIVVRNSLVEYNVAGIEIENSIGADVYGNTARHNTGGILVFDLPDLPMLGGHSTRIFNNKILTNNTANFAPPGNIVASVPAGTGVMIMANENVHVFDNEMVENETAHVLVVSYPDGFSDERYNPLARNIVIRDNSYTGGGNKPAGLMADLAAAVGGALPPIVWDGVVSWSGGEAVETNIAIEEAAEVSFISLGFGAYPLNPAKMRPSTERPDFVAVDEPTKIVLTHVQDS